MKSLVTTPILFNEACLLAEVPDKRDRLIFATGFYLGLRCGEMTRLTWGEILGNHIDVYQPKTGKVRHIKVPSLYSKVAQECYEGQRLDKYVFTARRGASKNKPLTVAGVNKIIRKWMKELGVETRGNNSSHCLRKTFSRRYWEVNGRSLEALEFLRNQLGHSHINITLRYIGVDYEQQAENMERLCFVNHG